MSEIDRNNLVDLLAYAGKPEEYTFLVASAVKLAGLDIKDHEFCCARHQGHFLDIRSKADAHVRLVLKIVYGRVDGNEVVRNGYTLNGRDYALKIYTGAVNCSKKLADEANAAKVVEIQCVHRTPKLRKQCKNVVKGTPKEIGAARNRCKKHS